MKPRVRVVPLAITPFRLLFVCVLFSAGGRTLSASCRSTLTTGEQVFGLNLNRDGVPAIEIRIPETLSLYVEEVRRKLRAVHPRATEHRLKPAEEEKVGSVLNEFFRYLGPLSHPGRATNRDHIAFLPSKKFDAILKARGMPQFDGFHSLDGITMRAEGSLEDMLWLLSHELVHRAGFRRYTVRSTTTAGGYRIFAVETGYNRLNKAANGLDFDPFNEGITDLIANDFWSEADCGRIGVDRKRLQNQSGYPDAAIAVFKMIEDLAPRLKETPYETLKWIRRDLFGTAQVLPRVIEEIYGVAVLDMVRSASTQEDFENLVEAMRRAPRKK